MPNKGLICQRWLGDQDSARTLRVLIRDRSICAAKINDGIRISLHTVTRGWVSTDLRPQF